MTVIDEVAAERKRQIEEEGWSFAHDDEHAPGDLAAAAGCYALHASRGTDEDYCDSDRQPTKQDWPWWNDADVSGGRGDCPVWGKVIAWWKPKNRRRDLIRAAALIVAEIERLDRLAHAKETNAA
ncbi:MAG: hypothetical protein Q7S17_09960 [Xanthobacteraceae bacterium]|nr:hypothetical protein [Xanthobacteraceae bacterium]